MDQGRPPEQQKPAAWWSGSVAEFAASDEATLLGVLANAAMARFRASEPAQLRAWSRQIAILRDMVRAIPHPAGCRLLIEFEIPRLRGRIDAVLLSPCGIFVLEFKVDATGFNQADRDQAEDYAADLRDFHAGSRRYPILPILIATDAVSSRQTLPLAMPGVAPVMQANAKALPGLVHDLALLLPTPPCLLDVGAWEHAPYRPVPNVIDAACLLFNQHGVADIVSARADTMNLTRTTDRIGALMEQARARSQRMILFVTGIPGAGKTLCGLNVVFGVKAETGSAFLTGNPTLVHVLREALVRDAVRSGASRPLSVHRMQGVIQALPAFRDHLVRTGEVPAERVIIIDEAQRSWTAAQAVAKTRDRPVQLSLSEPEHLLDIMSRHTEFAVIVCLIGNGQEIHDGEGGLAEWGEALKTRPEWQIAAAAQTLTDPEPRNRLPSLPGMVAEPDLHLGVPVRSLRHDGVSSWVDAMLRADVPGARAVIARHGEIPFRLTRSLPALRANLRASCRDIHRSGRSAAPPPACRRSWRRVAAYGCRCGRALVSRPISPGCPCVRRA